MPPMTLLSTEDYCMIGNKEEEKKNVLIRVMVSGHKIV